MADDTRLINWTRRQLLAVSPRVDRFELRHGAGEFASVLLRLPRLKGTAGEEINVDNRAKEIAADVLESALDCQEALEGRQVFRLVAVDAASAEQGAMPLGMGKSGGFASSPERPAGSGSFESPDFDGKNDKAILMKMVQNQHSFIMGIAQNTLEPAYKIIARQQDRIEKLESTHDRAAQLREELESEKYLRDTDTNERDIKNKRVDALIKKAIEIGGGHIEKRLLLGAVSGYQEQARSIFAVLPIFQIANLLDDEHRAILARLSGMGEAPKDEAEFRALAKKLWGAMPDAGIDLVSAALENHRDLANKLQELLKG